MRYLLCLTILVANFLDSFSLCLDRSACAFISSNRCSFNLFLGAESSFCTSSRTFRGKARHNEPFLCAAPRNLPGRFSQGDDGGQEEDCGDLSGQLNEDYDEEDGYSQSEIEDSDAEDKPKKKRKVGKTIKDNYSEVYKKILNSPSRFSGPSYSQREYGEELPEGSKVLFDFLPYPRNYDFYGAARLSSGVQDYYDPDGSKEAQYEEDVKERAEGGDRFHGPFPKSAYYSIDGVDRPDKRIRTTLEAGDIDVDPEDMFDIMVNKNVDPPKIKPVMQKPSQDDENEADEFPETRLGPPDNVPMQNIDPGHFLFDDDGHIQHYLKYLNRYDYKTFSFHHKDPTRLEYYLNNDYIDRIEKPFPPPETSSERVRKYFMGMVPSLMDELVVKIKNDPNKHNVASPPLHNFIFLSKFKMPDYLTDDYDGRGDDKDYKKFASLEGLHNPSQSLTYPYSNKEPLRQRQLLSAYIDIVDSQDLGTLATRTKRFSKTKALRRAAFSDITKPPLAHPMEDSMDNDVEDVIDSSEYGNLVGWSDELDGVASGDSEMDNFSPDSGNIKKVLDKLYVKGRKKRGFAMVYLEPGIGHIIINNRDGYQYLHYNKFWIRNIMEPLTTLYLDRKFNIVAQVRGGGLSGQSVAIRHAVVKYIYTILAPKLKPFLRICDLVTPDIRRTERKKTNLRKARKKEKYSKR
ncbi:ribosomal protein S9 family member protein [Theileria equi strain WA]|uniref:Ribosomal protein S9 family member protein n=1 Tax=Theileria equi strain WA TaxID=1537102 RepID=L0AWD8_THEEQ|nr:ribosomal protein S9 family member protein [Theileria equi strain WA]AFZ79224.1 ribosomal protein S9 family member protein [Theileria equi strain WA]|eukprot:XP_004828890.1 ribosomal protein S9 family member protein [Theileria equi strain WA]